MTILCYNNCLFKNNKIIIVGQLKKQDANIFKNINILNNNKNIENFEFIRKGTDFFIHIQNDFKFDNINNIYFDFIFIFENKQEKFENILLFFPFVDFPIKLCSETSTIISTMCLDYNHRLIEWIEYNKKLGFSAIIIFNNDENTTKYSDDDSNNCCKSITTKYIIEKYKNFVFMVNFPLTPHKNEWWDTIQRLSFYISIKNFKDKCKFITLIDPDEFIYCPKIEKQNIIEFLKDYHITVCMKSNLLTNKASNDYIDNDILKKALYIGANKYTKIFLYTKYIEDNEFIISPHKYKEQVILNKNIILHYHVWFNKRLEYNENMRETNVLKKFLYW